MTEKERVQKAKQIYSDLESVMLALYTRHQSERGYENITDYAVNIKPVIEQAGGQFGKMLKKPFGFTYQLDCATYQVSVNSREYKYVRIA